jgi:SAM-dependent methyltransferase
MMADQPDRTNAASTGLVGTETGFLDAHFEALRPDYEAMLRSVGLQPGWRVLDAACGSGSFLPLIADQIGPSGAISAFDLAPDSVAQVQQLITDQPLSCPIDVQVASLLALPYPDASFDAVWCANALLYLSDAELLTALAEFRRVVRPGGVVASKEPDLGLFLFTPGDAMRVLRTWAALGTVSAPFCGALRGRAMRRLFEQIGLEHVWQRGTLSEVWAPLSPVQRQYIGRQLMQMAAVAEEAAMAEDDLAFWRRQHDPDAPESLVNDPNLFWCEGHFVAVGRVPDRSA